MGYTVRYPEGWAVTPASQAWVAGEDDFWDMPNGDRIESADAGFRGGSQALRPGQTADEWMRTYLGDVDPDCGGWEQIPLGGATATINLNGCHGLGRLGGRVYDVVVVVGERAYNFTMEGAVDRTYLDAFLGSITFDPSSAID